MKSILLIAAISLSAFNTWADSIFEMSNCPEAEYTQAQKILAQVTDDVAHGLRTKLDLAMTQVYATEVSLCAGRTDKAMACTEMIKNQEFVTSFGAASKLDELRRLKQIKTFCGK